MLHGRREKYVTCLVLHRNDLWVLLETDITFAQIGRAHDYPLFSFLFRLLIRPHAWFTYLSSRWSNCWSFLYFAAGPKDTPMDQVLEKTYDAKTGKGMPSLWSTNFFASHPLRLYPSSEVMLWKFGAQWVFIFSTIIVSFVFVPDCTFFQDLFLLSRN